MSAPSRVHVDSVRAIAATIGAPPVDADTARALASDCEYRLRQVFQDAMKCMRASKRTTLSAEVRAKTRAIFRIACVMLAHFLIARSSAGQSLACTKNIFL